MAKKKLNVKFLALVIGSLGVGVAVLGLVVLLQFRNDPVRHVTRGDTLMDEKEYETAMQQYIRAIGKAPSEMEYYDRAIDAANQIEPQSQERMRELYRLLSEVMAKKIEYAGPDGDLSAKDVRDETTADLLNNLDVYTFSLRRARENNVIQIHDFIGSSVRDIDASFYGLGEDEVDPRIRAAVRGLVVAPLWRGAYNLDEGDWEDGMEEIQEAIDLNPGYVPNQYGLLRGMLERFESDIRTKPDASLRRTLGRFNERLAEAQAAAEGPAPELDLLELERDQILFYAGKAGDGDRALGSPPDAEGMAQVIEGMENLAAADLDEYELRARIVELWWSYIRALSRSPLVNLDQAQVEATADMFLSGMNVAMESVTGIAPADEVDLRGDLLQVVSMNAGSDKSQVLASIERIDEIVGAAKNEKNLGPDFFVAKSLLDNAKRKRFELILKKTRMNDALDDEGREELSDAYTDIAEGYADEEAREADPSWSRVKLLYNTRLAADSEVRALQAEDPDRIQSLQEDSRKYSIEAITAARACEKNGALQLDGLALEAAIIVARYTGEVGTATRLFQSVMNNNPAAASEPGLQARLAELLAQSGNIEEAARILESIRLELDQSDQETLQRIAAVENIIRRNESGENLADVPGIEIMNAVRMARNEGDIDEVRRLLDEIADGRDIDRRVRVLGLLDRAALEEAEGNFEDMRMYASRALEYDPTNWRARIFMKSDANTTTLDRMRAAAETQFSDPQDINVQLSRTVANLLGNPGALTEDQTSELRATLDELQERIESAQDPRPMALSYMFERALMAEDFDGADGYLQQLVETEGGESAKTVNMASLLAQAQGDLDGAVRILADAVDNRGFGSDRMRLLLGEAYERRGDREDARAQFHEAFKQAPNRWQNALKYGQALLTDGQISDALQVLRAGRATGRNNPTYRDLWLYVEIQTGNVENAIAERRRLYAVDPYNFKNAIELARLLAESPVGREAVVHLESDQRRGTVAGEVRFTPSQWGRLDRNERRTYQLQARDARIDEARAIFEQLRDTDPTSPEVVVGIVGFGTNHKDKALPGDVVAEAEAMLKEEIADSSGMEQIKAIGRLSRILAEKGRIAYMANDMDTADACFDEAAGLEVRTVDEALTAIASMLYAQNDQGRASKYQRLLLTRLEDAGANKDVRRRIAAQLANMYIRNQELDLASEVAEGYFDADSAQGNELTVLGTIAFGKADRLRQEEGVEADSGLPANVVQELDTVEKIYERALELNARDIDALIQLAALADYRWMYGSEAESEALFEDAVKANRRAVDNNKAYWPARSRLVTLLARNDVIPAAITELREHLELMPDTDQARTLLIQFLESEGRITDAIDLAQESLERDPTNLQWAMMLGRLRGINKEYAEAAQLFAALYEQTGDVNYLRSQVSTLMAWTESDGSKPGAVEVIDLVRPNQREFSRDMTLMGAYCTALINAGRRNEGLRNFEKAYRQIRDKPTQQRGALSNWLSELFPRTLEGAEELRAYLNRISDDNPSVIDLIEVARSWDSVGDVDGVALGEAIGTAKSAVSIEAGDVETASALGFLGILLTKNEDCDGALDAFERALALRKTDPQLLNNIAFLMSKCEGDLDVALERAVEAVKARPYRPEFRDTLGSVYLARARAASNDDDRERDYRRARQELELAARLSTLPSSQIQLAELEIERENYSRARDWLRKAGDRNPSADVQERIDELLEQLKGR